MMKIRVWAMVWALLGVNVGMASNLAQDNDDNNDRKPNGRPIQAQAGPRHRPTHDLHGFERLVVDGTGAVYGVSPDRVATYLDRFPAELFFIADETVREHLMDAFTGK